MYRDRWHALALIVALALATVAPRVIGPGTPDAGVIIHGRYVQLEYWHCLADSTAVWYEDGSAVC